MVVLNAKLTRLLAAHANKKGGEKRRNPTGVPCFASSNTQTTSIAVLTVHAKTSLIYTFQQSMQANRNINLW